VFVTAYLDDILVYSKNLKEHEQHVRLILQALQYGEMRIKPSKCEFATQKTRFLGHIISPGKIEMDPEKIQTILDWPTPKKVKDVQQFNGLANYYTKFIAQFSKKNTLTELTKKDQPWKWTNREQQTFENLKKAFTEAPVLRAANYKLPFIIETDASDFAIAFVLVQKDEKGHKHPIMFWSRKMIEAEQRYDTHDKELLAIVEALRKCRVYVQGAKEETLILTDHRNLTYFLTTKLLSRRQARWSEELAEYHFRIEHQKGTENGQADALSRRPDYEEGKTKEQQRILAKQPDGSLRYPKSLLAMLRVDDVDHEIIRAYKNDSMATELSKSKNTSIQITEEGYILLYGKVYVPPKQVKRILQQAHDKQGHQGYQRTWKRVREHYYFPQMKRRVREYVEKCNDCWLNRPLRHEPYGEMQIMEIPSKPWEIIALDWIVKLPESTEPMTGAVYDSILVIVDKMSKYAYFVPYKEESSAKDLAY
jgi:hypothetical protein